MQLEPWVPPNILSLYIYTLVGVLVPGSSGGAWFVDIFVLLMGLQTLSSPLVLSLTPPLRTLCSVQWMTVSIHICICQALAEFLRGQLYQAPISKGFLVSAIVSGFGVCRWDGAISRWAFPSVCSTLCPYISFRQEQFWVKIFEMGGWPNPSMRSHAYPLYKVTTGPLPSLFLYFC